MRNPHVLAERLQLWGGTGKYGNWKKENDWKKMYGTLIRMLLVNINFVNLLSLLVNLCLGPKPNLDLICLYYK